MQGYFKIPFDICRRVFVYKEVTRRHLEALELKGGDGGASEDWIFVLVGLWGKERENWVNVGSIVGWWRVRGDTDWFVGGIVESSWRMVESSWRYRLVRRWDRGVFVEVVVGIRGSEDLRKNSEGICVFGRLCIYAFPTSILARQHDFVFAAMASRLFATRILSVFGSAGFVADVFRDKANLRSPEPFCLKPNPPYKFTWADKEVPVTEGRSVTTTERYMENYKNVSQDIRDQLNAKAEAVQIILIGIDNDIFSTVDACPKACEMWKAIEKLKQDKEVPISEGSHVTRTESCIETYKTILQDIRDQLNAEAEAVQIILTGIDNAIYSTVDAFLNACEMWKAIKK
nr:hypothetical protein [Tanacetum cinerariifolium]